MTVKELEQRVSALERELQELRDQVATRKSGPNQRWLESVKKFTGDEDLLSIFRDAQKLREADRKKARLRPSARRKPKQ